MLYLIRYGGLDGGDGQKKMLEILIQILDQILAWIPIQTHTDSCPDTCPDSHPDSHSDSSFTFCCKVYLTPQLCGAISSITQSLKSLLLLHAQLILFWPGTKEKGSSSFHGFFMVKIKKALLKILFSP